MPNTRGSRAGSGTNSGPDDLVRVLRDEQIISLRRDGMTLRQIASAVDVAVSTVQAAVTRWLEERGPSAEQVEELREIQGAQLDALHGDLWPHRMRALRNEDGEILYEGPDDNRRPIQVPDVQVVDRIVKVMERRAKLYGLDLERSAGIGGVVTAEQFAAILGLDGEVPIDVDGEELPIEAPAALESGADPR